MNFWSVVPVIITLALAIITKNVLFSLFFGVFIGALIILGNPITAVWSMVSDYIIPQLQDEYNAGIIALLVFIGGFVTLLEKSGGAEAFAKSVSHFVNTRIKTQLSAWFGGIAVFFSELGTPLIVGPIFGPIFKKMRISKEKLAWIIDTTASPVCVLIPFIGWGVYSMGLIQTELDSMGVTAINDWSAFIHAIPYQIYPILCLLMVPLVAFSKKEFGAMARAEQNAKKGVFSTLGGAEEVKLPATGSSKHNVSPMVVIIPLVVLFVTLFGLLVPLGFPFKQVPGSQFRIALISGYLLASIVMILLMAYYKVDTVKGGVNTYVKGTSKLFSCILMLILAWALSAIGKELGTAEYIVGLVNGNLPAQLVPALIFALGAIMSFATGTSWGTFAIVMPLAIPMAVTLDAPLYATIAAVLSGGLFGDHCSPVSDTTILAATGAGCGLMEHMWTQLPYALICAGVSFVGFILAGFVESPIVTVISAVLLAVVYLVIAKYKGITVENAVVDNACAVDTMDCEKKASAA